VSPDEAPKVAGNQQNQTVTFKGKVLKPNGTPASRTRVALHAAEVVEHPRPAIVSLLSKPVYLPKLSSTSALTDEEGNFVLPKPIPTGANVVISVESFRTPEFVAEPLVFLSERDRHDMTIQLQEGILVNGTATYDDGTPAVGRGISAKYPIAQVPPQSKQRIFYYKVGQTLKAFPPITPATKASEMQDIEQALSIPVDFTARVRANGKFELYLPPGNYQISTVGIRDDSRKVSLSVKDKDQKFSVNLTMPVPLRGKFVKEDGTNPGDVERPLYVSTSKGGEGIHSHPIVESDGSFTVDKHKESIIIALTKDGSLGAAYPIPNDKLDAFHTVVLKPTATVKIGLRDSAGQPLVGEKVNVNVGVQPFPTSTVLWGHGIMATAVSDADGVATFRFPPGQGEYLFSWGGERSNDNRKAFVRTLQPGEMVEIRE
jgi:hypothetical protein